MPQNLSSIFLLAVNKILNIYYSRNCQSISIMIREWSLIRGRGATKREGMGASEVLPLQKGGGRKKFKSCLRGVAEKVLG